MAVVATMVLGMGVAPVAAHASGGPAIVVTPRTNLAPGQIVIIKGFGFARNQDVAGVECVRGATDPSQCDLGNVAFATTDAHGAFTTDLAARRSLLVQSGFTDCAPAACEMLFALASDFFAQATTNLTFDPSDPLPPTSMDVNPATDLADLQSVTVSGKGFASHADIELAECVVAAFSCGPNTEISALGNGKFSTTFAVHRILSDANGTRIDCAAAAGTCELLAFDVADVDYHSTAALGFDPNLPPPPPPSVKVTPNTKLPYYARVSVTGKHWTPGDFIPMLECASKTSSVCAFLSDLGVPDDSGTFTAQPMLQREIVDPFNPESPPVDCAAAGAHCVFIAQSVADQSIVTAPVSFDPNAPIPPAPSVTTTPNPPYKNNQNVRFKARNFAPLASFSVTECAITSNAEGCVGSTSEQLTGANGSFTTTFQVERVLDFGDLKLDCRKANTTCVLQIASEGGAEVDLPLTFTAGGSSAAFVTGRQTVLRGWASPGRYQLSTSAVARASARLRNG